MMNSRLKFSANINKHIRKQQPKTTSVTSFQVQEKKAATNPFNKNKVLELNNLDHIINRSLFNNLNAAQLLITPKIFSTEVENWGTGVNSETRQATRYILIYLLPILEEICEILIFK